MEAKLLHIPCMVSVLYSSIPLFWFAIHPFAGSCRKMRRSPYLLLLPLWAMNARAAACVTVSEDIRIERSQPIEERG